MKKAPVWVALLALCAGGCELVNASGVDSGPAQPADSSTQPDAGADDPPPYTVSAPELTWATGQAGDDEYTVTLRGGPAFHFSDDRYTVRGRLTQ